jgi:hypothetical protein
MCALCQWRPTHRSKQHLYSITSSARPTAEVSMALRRRDWSPYALRLDTEQHAWIALVMDWQRAA